MPISVVQYGCTINVWLSTSTYDYGCKTDSYGPIRIARNDAGLYPWLIRRPICECVTSGLEQKVYLGLGNVLKIINGCNFISKCCRCKLLSWLSSGRLIGWITECLLINYANNLDPDQIRLYKSSCWIEIQTVLLSICWIYLKKLICKLTSMQRVN